MHIKKLILYQYFNLLIEMNFVHKILSTETDRSEQTVQTQIRLLL